MTHRHRGLIVSHALGVGAESPPSLDARAAVDTAVPPRRPRGPVAAHCLLVPHVLALAVPALLHVHNKSSHELTSLVCFIA